LHRKTVLLGTVLFVLLCASLILSVKADATMWTQTYGGSQYDEAWSLVESTDGGYTLAGYTGYDFWLVKTDSLGNMEWNQTYGGEWPDFAYSLIATSDGGYALAGYTESYAVEDPDIIPLDWKPADFWLIKTDSFGNMIWNQTYGGKVDEKAYSLVATSDGGYALAGYAGSYTVEDPYDRPTDFWLVKTDEFGNVEWNQTYGGAGNDAAYSLVAASDGGYALVGGGLLVKTDEFGNMEWNQTYSGSFWSLVATSDGGYVLAGSINTIGSEYDFWLVKTDEFGNMEWNQTYGGADREYCYSLVATSDSGYAIVGSTYYSVVGDFDIWLVKTDVNGNMQWNQTYGGTEWESAYSLVATSDGGYAIAGSTSSFGAGHRDFWLVKTDELGNVPEAAWVVLPLLAIATVSIFISKKKLLRKNSEAF
jgi:hypothetical protein